MSDSDVGDQYMLITILADFSISRIFHCSPQANDSQSINVFLCLPLALLPSIIPVSAIASDSFSWRVPQIVIYQVIVVVCQIRVGSAGVQVSSWSASSAGDEDHPQHIQSDLDVQRSADVERLGAWRHGRRPSSSVVCRASAHLLHFPRTLALLVQRYSQSSQFWNFNSLYN